VAVDVAVVGSVVDVDDSVSVGLGRMLDVVEVDAFASWPTDALGSSLSSPLPVNRIAPITSRAVTKNPTPTRMLRCERSAACPALTPPLP
jgi:hypothetical protein